MGTDLDSVPENTGKVKKTKSKKTKYSDDALVEPTKVDPKGGDDAELKKEKKRKRKAEKVEEDDEKPKKSKKRKKEQNPLTVVEDGPAPTSPIDADSANPADRDSHESKEKKREKKKKDKKHKKDPEGRTDEPSKDEVRIKKDKKKKRRGDTLANPEEDDTLEDQARKGETSFSVFTWTSLTFLVTLLALVYVYTQIENPSRWKFNKAKQNWLIRNIWSSQAVHYPTYSCDDVTLIVKTLVF